MNLFRQDHENIGSVGLTLGGLRLPWLGSRVSVPSQKLRSGPGGESAKSEPLDQWPVTRPGPLRFVEKNPTKTEISETQVKRLLGGREYSTCGQTRGQAQRHSCPRGSLNHLCGAFPLGPLLEGPGAGSGAKDTSRAHQGRPWPLTSTPPPQGWRYRHGSQPVTCAHLDERTAGGFAPGA